MLHLASTLASLNKIQKAKMVLSYVNTTKVINTVARFEEVRVSESIPAVRVYRDTGIIQCKLFNGRSQVDVFRLVHRVHTCKHL